MEQHVRLLFAAWTESDEDDDEHQQADDDDASKDRHQYHDQRPVLRVVRCSQPRHPESKDTMIWVGFHVQVANTPTYPVMCP